MNCDRAEKAEKASHPGNLPTSLLLISRMKKSWRKKRVFLEFFSLFCFSFWFLNLIHSYNMGILQKNWFKTSIPAWNRCSNILVHPIWSRHRLLCFMTNTKNAAGKSARGQCLNWKVFFILMSSLSIYDTTKKWIRRWKIETFPKTMLAWPFSKNWAQIG